MAEGETGKKSYAIAIASTAAVVVALGSLLTASTGFVKEAKVFVRQLWPTATTAAVVIDPIEALEKKAAVGDVGALFTLGAHYWNGEDVPQDMARGLSLFRRAASRGSPDALYALGLSHYEGFGGLGVNKEKGLAYIEQAADAGHVVSLVRMGNAYLRGEERPQDSNRGLAMMQVAADKKSPEAAEVLGIEYYNGNIVAKNLSKSLAMFRFAADAGRDSSMVFVAEAYRQGDGVEVNMPTSMRWYRRAAEKGNCGAQYSLSVIYIEGRGVTKDLPTAKEWMEKADAGEYCSVEQRRKITEAKKWFKYKGV